MIYADTNALVRFYIDLPGSSDARELLADHVASGIEPLPVTWLLELELVNALEQAVHVSRTSGQMRVSPENAAAAQAFFRDDLRGAQWLRQTELLTVLVREQFMELAFRHTAAHGFRTYDLLHVAAAQVLKCSDFWSFDIKARKLAELEGLRLNPLAREASGPQAA